MDNKLEKYIQNNLDELDRKKPDPIVLTRILQQMQAKEKNKPGGILVSFRTIRWAAACILTTALGIAIWQFQKQPRPIADVKKEVTTRQEVKQPDNDTVKHTGLNAVDEALVARKSALMAEMKNKKLAVFADFNKIESAAGRLAAVSSAAACKNQDNDVVNALLQILDNDPNTNVRLAALDGLASFYREDYTRKKLLTSLKKQTSPVVQIALIGLLTRMRTSGILTELEKMVHDENTEKAVKDCAYSGILQMRS